MIVKDEFRLDDNRRELLATISDEFPYSCLDVTLNLITGRGWHWHNAFEIDLVVSGNLVLKTPMRTVELAEGDAVFINAGILHDARARYRNKDCRLFAQLFYPVFLSGMYGSLLEKKYIQPMMDCPALDVWCLRNGEKQDRDILPLIHEIIRQNETNHFGGEFRIRALLGEIWCRLLEKTEEYRSGNIPAAHLFADTERMRAMIVYIQEHYMEEIRVADIAKCANISIRECNRCFQKNVGISPAKFLQDYRLRMAMHLLLETPGNITQIGEKSGFSSPSHFGKVFRDKFGCSPLQYRKHMENAELDNKE